MGVMYLKCILQESEISTLSQFFKLQIQMPFKGDWASYVMKELKELRINQIFEEIKMMSKNQLTKLLNKKST